jgi:multiple sugar transport system permease protein
VIAFRRLLRRPVVITVLAALLGLVYLFPVYWMVATSLKQSDSLFSFPPQLFPSPIHLGSYIEVVFSNASTLRAIGNSFIIATGTMLLTILIAAPAAYALARLKLRFTAWIVFLMLVAQMLPTINISLPLFALFSQFGLVNTYQGLILANTSLTIPLAIVILRPYFLTVPEALVDAAMLDGCNRWTAFTRVVVPTTRTGLISAATITFFTGWGEFVFALSLAVREDMQPISVTLSRYIGDFGTQWNNLMAVSTVLAFPIIVLFIVLQRYVVGGLTGEVDK